MSDGSAPFLAVDSSRTVLECLLLDHWGRSTRYRYRVLSVRDDRHMRSANKPAHGLPLILHYRTAGVVRTTTPHAESPSQPPLEHADDVSLNSPGVSAHYLSEYIHSLTDDTSGDVCLCVCTDPYVCVDSESRSAIRGFERRQVQVPGCLAIRGWDIHA